MADWKAAVLLLPIVVCSCARQDDSKGSAPLNKYSIHGEILRLNAQEKTATIHHKDIDGFMKSMTMTFPVKDPREFSGLHENTCVEGHLYEQGDSLWLGDLTQLDQTPDQCVPPPAGQ